MEFNYEQLEGLQKMLTNENDEEDDQHVYGSALNPSSLHGN